MKSKADNPPLDVISSIVERRSIRAFLKKEVPSSLIINILDVARFAPSGVNTQPWHVAVLGPHTRAQITAEIIALRDANIPENPDYHYYPTEWHEPYKSRRKACGIALYGSLNIDIGDKERRKEQWYKNYHFFHAPVALMFYLEASLCKGSWMDMGMFIQNVMLAARGFGLETCPQAALAEYPDVIRKHLNLSPTMHIVCGMAIGYADWQDPVNQYRTAREEVDTFTSWYD